MGVQYLLMMWVIECVRLMLMHDVSDVQYAWNTYIHTYACDMKYIQNLTCLPSLCYPHTASFNQPVGGWNGSNQND